MSNSDEETSSVDSQETLFKEQSKEQTKEEQPTEQQPKEKPKEKPELFVNPHCICIKRVEQNQDRNFVVSVLCNTYGIPNTINFIERKDQQNRKYYTAYVTFHEVYNNRLVVSVCASFRHNKDFKMFIDDENNGQQKQRYWYLCSGNINNMHYRPAPLTDSDDINVPKPITVHYDNYAALAEIWNTSEEEAARACAQHQTNIVNDELCGLMDGRLKVSTDSPKKANSNTKNDCPIPRTVTMGSPVAKSSPSKYATEIENQLAFEIGLKNVYRSRTESDAVQINWLRQGIEDKDKKLERAHREKKDMFVTLLKEKEEKSKVEERWRERFTKLKRYSDDLYDTYSDIFDDNVELQKRNEELHVANRKLKRFNHALNVEHEELCDEIVRLKKLCREHGIITEVVANAQELAEQGAQQVILFQKEVEMEVEPGEIVA